MVTQTSPQQQSPSDGVVGGDGELLDVLRSQSAFSFDAYGSLNEVLEGIETGIGEKLSQFANGQVTTKLDDIKLFSTEDFTDNGDDSSVLPVQLHDSENNTVCVIAVPVGLFFYLMEYAFGGEAEETISAGGLQISDAESAVFYVFCQNIADGLYAGISAYSSANELISGQAGKLEEVAGWINGNELITIKLGVEIGSFNESVLLFLPIEMLEPMRDAPETTEIVEEETLDLDWVQDLNKVIDRTTVELRMVLAQSELSLGEIGRLVAGQRLDVGLSMQDVPVSDFEGNLLFRANLERLAENSQLRVTGGIRILKR